MKPIIRLALAALLAAGPALAAEAPYLTAAQVDLMRLLPPPPAQGSPVDLAEMEEVVSVERTRTPARAALATADAAETVFDMFGALLGPRFAPAAIPAATRLFARLEETEEDVVGPAKKGFARPRPHLANPALKPVAPQSRSGSYPSGHATRGAMMGIVVAAMLPEMRDAIFARTAEYAESRVVAGVHYRSDIVAGRQAGTAIGAVLMNDPGFMAEYGPARAEVRRALGLTP